MLCPRCKQVHPLGAACELVTGAIVGEYSLVRELGRGAVGVVFLARHRTSGLEVALKLLHRHLADEPVSVRRLTREARFAKELGPQRVVNVIEFHEQGEFGPWLAMEYLPGDSFLELARQRIAPDEALRVLALTAELLAQSHTQHVLHAALRPTNVFRLRAEGRPGGVLLLPFGVSLHPARSSEALEDREVDALGSAEFRPPEQTSGSPPDVRMDVYSLGAVSYLLATGRFPFTAPTPQALERAHLEVVPIAPHRINPRISRGWSLTIMKALEKAPGARFQTMAEFAQALREAPATPEPAGTSTAMFTRPAAVEKAPPAAKVGVVRLGGDDDDVPVPTPTPAGLGPITSGFARAALAPPPAARPSSLDGLFDDVPPPAPGALDGLFDDLPAPDAFTGSTPSAPPVAAGFGAFTETTPARPSSPQPKTVGPVEAAPPPSTAPIGGGFGAFTETTPARPSAPAPVAAGFGSFVETTPARASAPRPAGLDPFADSHTPAVLGTFVEIGPTPPPRAEPEGMVVTAGPVGAATPIPGPAKGYEPVATPAPSSLVLRVIVTDEKGFQLGEFSCSSVTRSGLVVVTSGPLPALMSKVKLTFVDLEGLLVDAQVVQHITVEQAAQWKMSAGFGVAFTSLGAEQRARIEAAQQRGVTRVPDTMSTILRRPDDPVAADVLARFAPDRDGYGMLGISKAAPFEAIGDRLRDTIKQLEDLADRPLSAAQLKALAEAKTRLEAVGTTLLEPARRMLYDAERGNFEGVARCISAGVPVPDIEAARARFLEDKPGLQGKSQGFMLAGQTQEARKELPAALQTYADLLKSDPLNLTAQQRYWSVLRQLE